MAVDIDAATLGFGRENLDRAGYTDVALVYGDGGLGYTDHAPYDRICVTAACPDVPPPLGHPEDLTSVTAAAAAVVAERTGSSGH